MGQSNKSAKNGRDTGKVREFPERQKVGTLSAYSEAGANLTVNRLSETTSRLKNNGAKFSNTFLHSLFQLQLPTKPLFTRYI